MATEWFLLAVVVLSGIHLTLVAYAFLRTERAGSRTTAPVGGTDDEPSESQAVVCPQCGTSNDPEYRYCRQCVAELSMGPPLPRDQSRSWSRGSL